jgi:hypothetical protein
MYGKPVENVEAALLEIRLSLQSQPRSHPVLL